MRLRLTLLLLLPLLFSACAKTTPPTKPASYYVEEAEQFLQKGAYSDAVAAWEKVRDNYYSAELSTLAELKIAEAQFLDEKYPEATASYELFLKAHPTHPQTAFVLYRLCYYRQILPADRDQTATRNARITFRNLRKLFPDDSKAAEVDELLKVCNERLTEQEFLIGDFYLRTGKYQAAAGRLEPLLVGDAPFAQREKLYYDLVQIYFKLGRRNQAEQVVTRLENEFPQGRLTQKVRAALAAD